MRVWSLSNKSYCPFLPNHWVHYFLAWDGLLSSHISIKDMCRSELFDKAFCDDPCHHKATFPSCKTLHITLFHLLFYSCLSKCLITVPYISSYHRSQAPGLSRGVLGIVHLHNDSKWFLSQYYSFILSFLCNKCLMCFQWTDDGYFFKLQLTQRTQVWNIFKWQYC